VISPYKMHSVSIYAISTVLLCLSGVAVAAPPSVLHRPRANLVKARNDACASTPTGSSTSSNGGQSNSAHSLTVAQLLEIAPTANTCDNAPAAGECSTAQEAVPFITQSFTNYNVTSPAEQAALISLMAFETDELKYKKNHFPGVPGQGSKKSLRCSGFEKSFL
jgi:hypothetical protein